MQHFFVWQTNWNVILAVQPFSRLKSGEKTIKFYIVNAFKIEGPTWNFRWYICIFFVSYIFRGTMLGSCFKKNSQENDGDLNQCGYSTCMTLTKKVEISAPWIGNVPCWNTCARMIEHTDYERPMQLFFIEIPNFWTWADNMGRQIWGHLGYFRPIYQHPFWYCESLVNVFH